MFRQEISVLFSEEITSYSITGFFNALFSHFKVTFYWGGDMGIHNLPQEYSK